MSQSSANFDKVGSLVTPSSQSEDDLCASSTLAAQRSSPRLGSGPIPVYTWYVVLLLTIINVVSMTDRMALSILAPQIKSDLHLSDAKLGLLTGFAFAVFYAVCGIPIARWADRGVRKNIIALAMGTWSVMTALSGMAQNFLQLFCARIGIGIGEAGCLPTAQSIICDYVPLSRRPGMFAIHTFGVSAGLMVGMSLGGLLGQMLGWRLAFICLGIPGIFIGILVKCSLREPLRGNFERYDRVGDTASKNMVLFLLKCRTYRSLVLQLVVVGFIQYGLNQWWPSFYIRQYGLSLSHVGLALGLASGIGLGSGNLFGGVIANRAAERDVRRPLLIGAAATLLALLPAIGVLLASGSTASFVMVGITGFFLGISHGPVLAAIYSVVFPHMRATAGAIAIMLTSILGFGLGPFAVGFLSDLLRPEFGESALRYALLLPSCLIPVLVLALYRAAVALPADLATAGDHAMSTLAGGTCDRPL